MDELITAILEVAKTNKIIIERYDTGIKNMAKEMAALQSSTDMILSLLQPQPQPQEEEPTDFMLEIDKQAINETITSIIASGNQSKLTEVFVKNEMVGKKPAEIIKNCNDLPKLRSLLIDLKRLT